MGTCKSKGHGQNYSLSQLQNLGYNRTKQGSTGCCPNIGGAQGGSGQQKCKSKGFGWPNNSEFSWGGLGSSCKMCSEVSGGYGCSSPCGSGGATISGKRPRVKRIAYKANPTDCCLHASTTHPLMGRYTCDPKYRGMTKSGCFDVLQDYCNNNNVFGNKCKSWAVTSPAAQASVNMSTAEYCNNPSTYKSNGDCRAWCNSTAGRGKCDNAVTDFCHDTANKDNSICSCINSPLNFPQCSATTNEGVDVSDVDCQHSGYLTSNMSQVIQNAACPTVYNCKQDFHLGGTNNIVRDQWMVQVCGPQPIPPVTTPSIQPSYGIIAHTTIIPGTQLNLPDIPGVPMDDFVPGVPNTLLVLLFIMVLILVLTSKTNSTSSRYNRVPRIMQPIAV